MSDQIEVNGMEESTKNAQRCESCHGENGISLTGSVPNLAGLSAQYIYQQMLLYKSKRRLDEPKRSMVDIAGSLTEAQILAVSQKYGNLPVLRTTLLGQDVSSQSLQLGIMVAKSEACSACHDGRVNSIAPRLEGQKARYLEVQLLNYQAGLRKSPRVMEPVVLNMTAEQIKAVSEWYSIKN